MHCLSVVACCVSVMGFVGCWSLLFVGSLVVARCWLFVVRCSLFVVRCVLIVGSCFLFCGSVP